MQTAKQLISHIVTYDGVHVGGAAFSASSRPLMGVVENCAVV